MKHLNKLLVAVMMVMGLVSHAQDSNNPWALSFGINAVDTRTSVGGADNWLEDHFSQFFAVDDNWNILPSVSYIGLSRHVGGDFSVGLTGSINKIDRFVVNGANGLETINPGDLMYYGIDATIKYSFMNLIKSKVIDPSLIVGGGYTFIDDQSFGTFNLGGGLTFWVSETVGFSLGTAYKTSFGDRQDANGDLDSPSHFQHSLGLAFKFGGKDTDNDGIYDKDDACPDVPGLKQFNGCPDTDGDGIVDASDACPDVAGLAALNGCPDADGDGIADAKDSCPDVAGLAALNGCPDADGDGIADKEDKCPNEKGPKSNMGCPELDADKDGVIDKEDNCPTVAGPVSNKGCPEVTQDVLTELKVQARSVYFETGKATFKKGDTATPTSLDAIKEILKNYPNAKFAIEGHTDNTGSAKLNQKLSEDRANAIRDALIERGVNAANLEAKGYGSSKPVASNKTKEGRAKNRRTEVRHVGSVYEGKL